MSTKRFFHLQKSKASSPVKQTAGDVLAVSCETVLIVAKESFVHFSAIGEKKTCSLLLCRPWPGCLKRLFWAYLASLANPVMLEVTFRVKLQYTQKRSNKKWSISEQPVNLPKLPKKWKLHRLNDKHRRKGEKKNHKRVVIRISAWV